MSQEPDYPVIFGSNWLKAARFVEENKEWMLKTCNDNNVDFNFTSSVIFPELIRYSALRDKIEITLLKALYVHYGAEYSNFSIGVFQIKPGCAEEILQHISKLNDRQLYDHFSCFFRRQSDMEKRLTIVKELEEPSREIYFVVALIRILEKRYRHKNWENPDNKLRFFAAAYNTGFSSSEKHIRKMMTAKSFHTKISRPNDTYCYSDISSAFSRSRQKQK